jgi:hypothetical protein
VEGAQVKPLDARVAHALTSASPIAYLQSLIVETEAGVVAADAAAKREREKSLDPSTSPSDAEQASKRASIAQLTRDRLRAALPRVRQRLAEALAQDRADKWHADADKVDGMVAAAAERLAGYQKVAEQIVALLDEAEAANKEAERVNHYAPDGVHRRVEKVPMGHLKDLVLPDPVRPGRNLFPPHQPSFAAQYAASMQAPAHPGADWAAHQRARDEAARAEREKLARYHAEAGRREEERQNREERERFGHR